MEYIHLTYMVLPRSLIIRLLAILGLLEDSRYSRDSRGWNQKASAPGSWSEEKIWSELPDDNIYKFLYILHYKKILLFQK